MMTVKRISCAQRPSRLRMGVFQHEPYSSMANPQQGWSAKVNDLF